MIKFEDYGLGKPKLVTDRAAAAKAFTRSEFDYAPRQRRSYKGYKQSGFSLVLPHYLLDEWETFWSDINEGADIFEADFYIFGSGNLGKKLRFVEAYSQDNLGKLIYRVSVRVELIDKGTAYSACPLYPSATLYPQNFLYPC